MNSDGSFVQQFETVAIIGPGLIGGSLGMALRSKRLAQRVIGIGRDADRLAQAAALGAVDEWTTEMPTGVANADLIVLCTTVGHIVETLPSVLQAAKPHAIITDVGSTKETIVAQAAGFPFFVGSHPMAGSERGGVEAATPHLFQEATWAITPAPETNPHAVQAVRALAQEVGASTLVLAPDAHDAMVAVTSHLPHVIASSLMRQAHSAKNEYPLIAQLSAGSFADGTRVAASLASIWRDVCLTNRSAVLASIADFEQQLATIKAAIDHGDAAALEEFFASGAEAKKNWKAL